MSRLSYLAVVLISGVVSLCSYHQDEEECPTGLVPYEGECLFEPPPCGSPPGDCSFTMDATECATSDGYWDDWWRRCVCYAHDAGCPCWLPGHCQAYCVSDANDVEECRATVVGQCSLTTDVGCVCTTDHMAGPSGFELACFD